MFSFSDAADRKSDHLVIFVVASGIHHNTMGRKLNKFYKKLLSTLNKEEINKNK